MSSQYRMRNEDEYEDYDEYEEYNSGEEQEEEEEEEEEPPSQEQQEFLKLREELKEKFRQKLKKETAGHLQEKKRTAPKDNFGSFFGPSRPVIASRVIEERRSIRETEHITSRNTKPSSGNVKGAYSSSDKKTSVHKQQPKVVNEVKKKVQTLKGMRDYSFLLSDDADLPDTKEEQQPPQKRPLLNSDGRQAQAPASRKPQMAKPARPVPNGHVLKNPATKSLQSQSKVGPVKSSSLIRSKPATAEPKKIANGGSGSGRPVERKPLPSKIPAQSLGTSRHPGTIRPPTKVTSAVHHSSAQRNHYPEQRRPSQSLNNGKPTASKPLPSSKSQPPKKIPPPQDSHEDRLKKKPMKRRLDESDDEDAIGMIRKMFGYNPNKYAAVDDDVSDMEADFSEILKEERRSAKIARKEDEEQLRLIEEEERRERMRKKQKQRR